MQRQRHEIKYFINCGNAMALAKKLAAVLTPDPNASGEGNNYHVRSLYFDDAYQTMYYEKLAGEPSRDKYRLRIYNYDASIIHLERKRKTGSLIHKTSVRVSRRLARQLMDGESYGLESSENPLLQDLFIQMRLKLLRPVVLVDYLREAYCHPLSNVRVTIDKSLRTGLASKELFNPKVATVSPLNEDLAILEIKYDQFLPGYISEMLSGATSEQCAISKYVLCRRFELM